MAVVTWSPELRIEVKKHKIFNSSTPVSLANCNTLSAHEQTAVDHIFSGKSKESKEPKYDYWR